jgi:hypothetical protein
VRDASQATTGFERRRGHNCDGRRRKFGFRAGNAGSAPATAVRFPNNRNLAAIPPDQQANRLMRILANIQRRRFLAPFTEKFLLPGYD